MSAVREYEAWTEPVEAPVPDIRPEPVANVPSSALVTGLSQQISRLEAEVERMRRRVLIERGIWAGAIVLGIGIWSIPQLLPSAWALYANGTPVAAMRDKGSAQAVLASLRRAKASDPAMAGMLDQVEVRRVDPAHIQLMDAQTAADRLEQAVVLRVPRGVIYVDGKPSAALPDTTRANEVLEQLKAKGSAGIPDPQGTPTFKQSVEVRTEPAPQDLWVEPDRAAGLLSGKGSTGTHTVRSGETAWIIAREAGISLQELKTLNPGVNVARLQLGQQLNVGKAGPPPVTVVATGKLTQTAETPFREVTTPRPLMWAGKRVIKQHGAPGQDRVTYRVTYENGKPVKKEALERLPVQPPIDQIVAVGTKPRR